MTEVLGVLSSFPTAIYTTVVLLCLVYWLFVILGALDLDFLGGAEGAVKGSMEGAAKGLVEGAAKGMFGDVGADGGVEGAIDAKSGGAAGVGAAEGVAVSLVGLDSLRKVPVTISLSVFALFGLAMTGLFCLSWGNPGWLVGAGVFGASAILSVVMTAFAVRPLIPLFATNKAVSKRDLIGKMVEVSTGSVTESFGQAVLEDGGASLILQIRDGSRTLVRGDKVLLVDLDEAQGTYLVERLPHGTTSEGRRFQDDRAVSEELEREAAEVARQRRES